MTFVQDDGSITSAATHQPSRFDPLRNWVVCARCGEIVGRHLVGVELHKICELKKPKEN